MADDGIMMVTEEALPTSGAADCAAITQAVLDNATKCPTRVTRPTSGVGAGGLAVRGQRLVFDPRYSYRFDSQVTLDLTRVRSICLDGVLKGGAEFINNIPKVNGVRPPIFKIVGGGVGSPAVHTITFRHISCQGELVDHTGGHKPWLQLDGCQIYDADSDWAVRYGAQCYWAHVTYCEFRQNLGSLKGPGVFSDLFHVEDCTFAWGSALADVELNTAGSFVRDNDFEARQAAYSAVPHVSVYPRDYVTTTGAMTSGAPQLTLPTTVGREVGELVSVAGAVTWGLILSIDSGTQVTLSKNASATVAGAATTIINSAGDCELTRNKYGGESTGSSNPPVSCVVVGPTSVEFRGNMTSGSAVLSALPSTTGRTAGETIAVVGAGAAGAILLTTILSVDSATQLTLAAAAGTTISGAKVLVLLASPAGSAARTRIRLVGDMPKVRSDATGPSAASSKHYVTFNRVPQFCQVYDDDLSEENTTVGVAFASHPINEAYAAAGYRADGRSNRYGRLLLGRLQEAVLFSHGGASWKSADGGYGNSPSPYEQDTNLLRDPLRLDSAAWTRSNCSAARLDVGGHWRITTTNVLAELSQTLVVAEAGSYVCRVAARAGSLALVALFLQVNGVTYSSAEDLHGLDPVEWREVWCRATGVPAGATVKLLFRFGKQGYGNTGTCDLYWPTLERGELPSARRLNLAG